MKFKIHYIVNGFEDSYILSGETVKEIQTLNKIEMEKRNLDQNKNDCWSEEIK